MKNLFTILFVFCVQFCIAGTGGANDFGLFLLSIVAFLAIIVAIGYLTLFIIKKIKSQKEKALINTEINSESTTEDATNI